MQRALSRAHWDLILKASVLVYILTLVIGLVLSLLLPALLDWVQVGPNATVQAVSIVTALLVIVVTGYGALRVARSVQGAALLHGFLVGLVVAILSFLLDFIFSKQIGTVGLLLYALMIIAGLLGGFLASRR